MKTRPLAPKGGNDRVYTLEKSMTTSYLDRIVRGFLVAVEIYSANTEMRQPLGRPSTDTTK
jgi:hypothetical protein